LISIIVKQKQRYRTNRN